MDTVRLASPVRETVLAGAGTVLSVVSSDQDLITTCREVIHTLEDARDDSNAPCRTENPVRVRLWDFESDQNAPHPRTPEETIFYVVRPTNLDKLRANLPWAEGSVLLRPVTRLVLRAFLRSVAPACISVPEQARREIGTLRADRNEILQHLLRANLRLQEYDQQRTNFMARAVHDFRAPLTALSGFCGLLINGELGPTSSLQQEVLNRMQQSIKRISSMASAMFDLSIEPRLSRKPILREADILETIQQALHEVTPLAREKHVKVHVARFEKPTAPLQYEPSQIEQVLLNLLDNACKFVPKSGMIEIQGYSYFWERRLLDGNPPAERRKNRSTTPNGYRVDIRDTGPGVSRHLLESVFEEYTSYSGPHDRSGGGLGLAICRLIISRHEGHVWAETNTDGTVFSFVLPFRRTLGGEAELSLHKSLENVRPPTHT